MMSGSASSPSSTLHEQHPIALAKNLLQALEVEASEVSHLHKTIADLKDENQCLRLQLSEANRRIALVEEALTWRPKRQLEFKQPPPEVLCQIFKRVLPPSFLLDSSVCAGPGSPWCQALEAKKRIVEVCRVWWGVGLEFLYEEVVIRHIGQLPALVRTLDNANNNLGALIKKIAFRCFIPRGYSVLFQKSLCRLLEHCPRLASYTYDALYGTDHCPFPVVTQYSLFSTITHLDCGDMVDYRNLFTMLQSCPGLISLAFHLPSGNTLDNPIAVCLDHLEALQLRTTRQNRFTLPRLAEAMVMPKLQRLTFELHYSKTESSRSDIYTNFCKFHGGGLKFLHIHPDSNWVTGWNFDALAVGDILNACPVLEHCVIPGDSILRFSHPTIKWVDFWCPRLQLEPEPDSIASAPIRFEPTTADLPSLRGIRRLDIGLLLSTSDFPRLISPDMVQGDEAFEFRFPGIHVQHMPGYLFRKDLEHMAEYDSPGDQHSNVRSELDISLEDDSTDDEDSSYSPPHVNNGHESADSDDSYDSGDSDNSDDSGDSDDRSSSTGSVSESGGEFYSTESWEIDPATALDIYQSTLDF